MELNLGKELDVNSVLILCAVAMALSTPVETALEAPSPPQSAILQLDLASREVANRAGLGELLDGIYCNISDQC